MKTFKTCFGIKVEAEMQIVHSVLELQSLIQEGNSLKDYIIVGGGSNLILNDEKKYKILSLQNKGIDKVGEVDGKVILKIAAGEVWDELVNYSVVNDLSGIEALSAIPGLVGAAAVQNIGAYGTELKDVLIKLEIMNLETGKTSILTNAECEFGYRDSIFKNKYKNKFIITHIYLSLSQAQFASLPKYKDVAKAFENDTRAVFPLSEIRDVITQIRWAKLPLPEAMPNVGSFFHNPILTNSELQTLQNILPNIPVYIVNDNKVKVPAGYLIEQAGLKGTSDYGGKLKVYEKHALVLVNTGEATFSDLKAFINKIQDKVKTLYNIDLQVEPEIIE